MSFLGNSSWLTGRGGEKSFLCKAGLLTPSQQRPEGIFSHWKHGKRPKKKKKGANSNTRWKNRTESNSNTWALLHPMNASHERKDHAEVNTPQLMQHTKTWFRSTEQSLSTCGVQDSFWETLIQSNSEWSYVNIFLMTFFFLPAPFSFLNSWTIIFIAEENGCRMSDEVSLSPLLHIKCSLSSAVIHCWEVISSD